MADNRYQSCGEAFTVASRERAPGPLRVARGALDERQRRLALRVRDDQVLPVTVYMRREVERLQVGRFDRGHRVLARELRRLDLLEADPLGGVDVGDAVERVAAGAAGRRIAVERDRRRHRGRHGLLGPVDARVLDQRRRAVEGCCRASRPRPRGRPLLTIRRRPSRTAPTTRPMTSTDSPPRRRPGLLSHHFPPENRRHAGRGAPSDAPPPMMHATSMRAPRESLGRDRDQRPGAP